ncbi:transcriptional repressor [Streptobacillus felis]|uniref:Transcriptional repressor n=1 Tax=Streptobacillus felis TaxID=1384509 RepID=A0A7Z0PDQ7_9FUSO|nr:Fur family transcriptional regulator [Streptobacillus felis]NYV27267.1 transcriptional repressor [Streptobacillus felis]
MHLIEKYLKDKGIKPSIHRIKILDYLHSNHIHPTVDKIYKDLLPELPTLSKTTVYNTLNLFVENKIANAIVIEGNETRYDVENYPHGHFKCLNCGKMVDFEIDYNKFDLDILREISIDDVQFYIKGKCKKCKD